MGFANFESLRIIEIPFANSFMYRTNKSVVGDSLEILGNWFAYPGNAPSRASHYLFFLAPARGHGYNGKPI
ncbi:hypothetical protein J6590_050894 [Homalodisca vitripennis]|nr:hypothetical protein J6590_050894 [Homalodisca vitripennis]